MTNKTMQKLLALWVYIGICTSVRTSSSEGLLDVITLNVAKDANFVNCGVLKLQLAILYFVRRVPSASHIIGLQEISGRTSELIKTWLEKETGNIWSMSNNNDANTILTDGKMLENLSLGYRNLATLISFKNSMDIGRMVSVVNLHLIAFPYGPYKLCRGDSFENVTETEQKIRADEVDQILSSNNNLINKYPVLILGDFNTPSHQDNVVFDERETNLCKSRKWFEWPVTKILEDSGFIDVYRSEIPEQNNSGTTWSPVFNRSNEFGIEPQDRIDMIWLRNLDGVNRLGVSQLRKPSVGSGEEYRTKKFIQGAYGDKNGLWTDNDWVSDHSAVTALLQWSN